MHCTIIICTRDRAAHLRECLATVAALEIPEGVRCDVVVVDNGSRDETAGVVDAIAPRLDIRRVFEPRAGLSNARNAGVAQAGGDYILWTDDDVLVEPRWLAAYAEAFARYPEASVFGGRITPVLEEPSPAWFVAAQADLGFLLAARDFGGEDRPLSLAEDRIPYGANYALRADAQRRHPYDPDLGIAPGRRRGGEETAVVKAMLAAGCEGWWIADAAVRHRIPPSRQSLRYVSQFYYAMGEAYAHAALPGRRLPPVGSLAKAAAGLVRLRCAEMLGLDARVRYLASHAYHRGVIGSVLHGGRSEAQQPPMARPAREA